jgi:hypothetical protein
MDHLHNYEGATGSTDRSDSHSERANPARPQTIAIDERHRGGSSSNIFPSFVGRGRSITGTRAGPEDPSYGIELHGVHMHIEEDVKVDYPTGARYPAAMDKRRSSPSLLDVELGVGDQKVRE